VLSCGTPLSSYKFNYAEKGEEKRKKSQSHHGSRGDGSGSARCSLTPLLAYAAARRMKSEKEKKGKEEGVKKEEALEPTSRERLQPGEVRMRMSIGTFTLLSFCAN